MPEKKPATEPNAMELEQQKYETEVAAVIGEPEPPKEPAKAKPDNRTAIQKERDDQAAVEKSVHNITLSEPEASDDTDK